MKIFVDRVSAAMQGLAMSNEQITQYDYRQEIKALAESVKTDYPKGVDVYEAVHELCDGHQWVIYTCKAYQVAAAIQPDWSEFESELGALPKSIEELVCWNMIQAVHEELERQAEEGAK